MTKLFDVVLPLEQQEGTESMLSQWLKKEGEFVKLHEPLAEVTTDKVNVEIASPSEGTLSQILVKEGEKLSPGQVLAKILQGGVAKAVERVVQEKESVKPRKSVASLSSSQELSPAVKKLLKEHNLDPQRIPGSGREGRITHDDVIAYLESGAPRSPSSSNSSIPSRKIPHSPMRKSIANHMVESLLHTAPHVTTVFELDLSTVIAHREKHKTEYENKGIRLTFTTYFVLAAVQAIKHVPEANARFHSDGLEIFEDINVGVATALEDDGTGEVGLIVPVIHKAQQLSFEKLAEKLQEVTEKARKGTLTPAEVRQGTFTISNHGVSGSLVATPIIINQPQSSILGIGKLEKRAVVMSSPHGDEIKIRPRLYVTLTIDHRVLDGFRANAFLSAFVTYLESGNFT